MANANNRWGVLYCPKHSRSGSRKRWNKIESCLQEHGIDFDFVQSERQEGVSRLVNMMINNGYKTIVIVGGDSALNDAANCLMMADKETRESKDMQNMYFCVMPSYHLLIQNKSAAKSQ